MECVFYFTFAPLFAINNILMKSFIFFLALFCELTLSAQAQYTVKGFVHNASLEGIPKVAIKVLDADTNLIVSEPLTDSESHLPNLDLYAYGNSESRQLKLNLTYQFGKAKEAHVNELEEVQRL